ncbi:MAG: hypothetical protein HY815_17995 [Candidatus Riflebacteria bacterium]|nr:hypothetical protein [Candidatus Riflebacteria bacterium]
MPTRANPQEKGIPVVPAIGCLAVLVLTLSGVRLPLSDLTADAGGLGGHSKTAVVMGLTGKVQNALPRLNKELDEATGSNSGYFPEIQEPYERVLAEHLQLAHDLRTVFGLQHSTPAYDPSDPVQGLSPDQVAGVNPTGFYNSALQGHLKLNDRLKSLLDDWSRNLLSADSERYLEQLNQARAMVTGRGGGASALE